MKQIHSRIVCCYLYTISKYGYPPPAEKTNDHLAEMKELGFESVELEGVHQEHLTAVHDMRHAIKDQIVGLGLKAPYFCIVLPGLASPDSLERQKNLRLFELGCETAKTLSAKGVLDNGPLPPYQFDEGVPVVRHYSDELLRSARFPRDLNWKSYWENLVGAYRQACDIAAHFGLKYHLHPCQGAIGSTTDSFLYFHTAVGRENLRFNFDTANQFFMRENLDLAFRRLADFVDYIHLSDNRGQRVEHLPLSAGDIPWQSFFETLELLEFSGDFGIDVGGAETEIDDLDQAYIRSARWIEERIKSRPEFD